MVKNEYFGNISPAGPVWGRQFMKSLPSGATWILLKRVVTAEPAATAAQRILEDVPDGWLASQYERQQLRNPVYTSIGIGIRFHPKENAYDVTGYVSNRDLKPGIKARPRDGITLIRN